jgi:S-adenosylmethionine:tRNA ribosyltransferase-isomerase
MKTSDFDYNLPPEFIAQTPIEPRDASRLIVLHRNSGQIEHRIFRQIGDYLHPGDLLVVNRTRVIPARIYARKPTGGCVELLLLRQEDDLTWECLVGGKGLTEGKQLVVEFDDSIRRKAPVTPRSGDSGLRAQVIGVLGGAQRRLRFSEPLEPHFPRIGHVPLPPYIHEKLADPERYQTVYADQSGSAAAPTAGLHFTPRMLDELRAGGVKLAYVTLHVGLDTFAPVTEDDPKEHKIHTEWCELNENAANAINQTKQSGGRVIAVGTTSVRTLESAAKLTVNRKPLTAHCPSSVVKSFSGPTSLYILPGFQFKVVDALITNFHLPKSTLIMLVSAFSGRQMILSTYEVAKQEGYRFYSFGDAMLIL